MITPNEAWERIVGATTPLPIREVSLEEGSGRYLAEPVSADRDIPAADRAAMDGYAVRAADVATVPVELTVREEIAAGSVPCQGLAAGEAARIYTGANLPAGADAVVMVEDTTPVAPPVGGPERVRVLKAVAPGANVFRQGENARQGQELVCAGTRLGPGHLAACAAVGHTRLRVHALPRVAVLCTGAELLAPEAAVLAHQTRNSSGPMLVATVGAWGYPVSDVGMVADDAEVLASRLQAALAASEVAILTGGVSVGKYDLVPEAVARTGATVLYHGVAMKPGKPQLAAVLSPGRCVFGLPGNPLSTMVGLHEFVGPALRRLAGCPAASCRTTVSLRLGQVLRTKGDRHAFVLGQVSWTASGPEVSPVVSHGTADLVAGSRADGTILVPPGAQELPAGGYVEFRPWRALP
jgi:molybdopterin molybdotransferase